MHPAMEVKTGQSLFETILSPAVLVPPSPLRYADHVSRNASPPLIDPTTPSAVRYRDEDTVSSSPGGFGVAMLVACS